QGHTTAAAARGGGAAAAGAGVGYVGRSTVGRRRGPRSRLVPLPWTPALAYAVGLAATDGGLINTGRHVAFVSSDRDLMESFLACIGRKGSNFRKDGDAYRAQLGDVELYQWLSETGLTQRKSLTLGTVEVPAELFLDLVR